MSTKPVTDSSFANDVLGSETPVLVDFWATWCGPCKQIGPSLEEISNEYGDKLAVLKMDIDESPNTPGQYGVRGVPTMMIFKSGELLASTSGARPKTAIVSWIEETLANNGSVAV